MSSGALTVWLLRLPAAACLAAPSSGLRTQGIPLVEAQEFPAPLPLLLQEPPRGGVPTAAPPIQQPPRDGVPSAAPPIQRAADEREKQHRQSQWQRWRQSLGGAVWFVLVGSKSETGIRTGSFDFYVTVLGSFGLCLFAGLMSGLTMGLMSFDAVELEVIERTGKGDEPRQAQQVKALVRDQHLLLVTLLICNAAAMEALPLMLDMLLSPFVAILLSVTGVLFFGEILPQALCKAFGLRIGSASAPIVSVLIIICYPVARPIALLLDWLLGQDHGGRLYSGPQMAAILEIHKEQGRLTQNEFQVMDGALALAQKTCSCCMTDAGRVQTLRPDAVLDETTMDWITETGYSRIPVWNEGEAGGLKGVLLVKKLLKLRPEDATPVRAVELSPMHHVSEDTLLYDLLDTFQQGKSHMAAVYGREHAAKLLEGGDRAPEGARMLGLVTLEDVIEQLIKEDVYDETDSTVTSSRQSSSRGSRSRSRSSASSSFYKAQVVVGWKLFRARCPTF